jgi:hypothetical protein
MHSEHTGYQDLTTSGTSRNIKIATNDEARTLGTPEEANPGRTRDDNIRRIGEEREIERRNNINIVSERFDPSRIHNLNLTLSDEMSPIQVDEWWKALQTLPIQELHLNLNDVTIIGSPMYTWINQVLMPSFRSHFHFRGPKTWRNDQTEFLDISKSINEMYKTFYPFLGHRERTLFLEEGVVMNIGIWRELNKILDFHHYAAYANIGSHEVTPDMSPAFWDCSMEGDLFQVSAGIGTQEVSGGHSGCVVYKTEALLAGANIDAVRPDSVKFTECFKLMTQGKKCKIHWGMPCRNLLSGRSLART